MRTNFDFGAHSEVEPAAMTAIQGGVAIAFDSRSGSALYKYMDQITERLSPTPDFSEPRDLDQPRLYP